MTFFACITANKPATAAPAKPSKNRLSIPFHSFISSGSVLFFYFSIRIRFFKKILGNVLRKIFNIFAFCIKSIGKILRFMRRPSILLRLSLHVANLSSPFQKNKSAAPCLSEAAPKILQKRKNSRIQRGFSVILLGFLSFAAIPFAVCENQIVQIAGKQDAGFDHKYPSSPYCTYAV